MVELAKALATNTTLTVIKLNGERASGPRGGGGMRMGWRHLLGCMVVWSRGEREVGAYSEGGGA